ncbi:MAG TPA: hypothetical protein VFI73_04795 [Candidatus Nitrosopolaris sp.]|nr:hypothetical protein [Candidatus Nitrosopolaris sp.]
MSTINQAEASKPLQQKKMQECNRCKTAGFPNQLIGFEKIGQDPSTGKINWRLTDENGTEHKHKFFQDSTPENSSNGKRRRVIDIAAITDVAEARKLLALGWDYKTSYPATISNIPHYILVKRQ